MLHYEDPTRLQLHLQKCLDDQTICVIDRQDDFDNDGGFTGTGVQELNVIILDGFARSHVAQKVGYAIPHKAEIGSSRNGHFRIVQRDRSF